MRPPFTSGVSTLGGFANAGYVDGGREVNLFNNPVNVAFGPDGKVYVAEYSLGVLKELLTRLGKIDAPGGAVD